MPATNIAKTVRMTLVIIFPPSAALDVIRY